MKRALVVKALTDQILLVRTDTGEILSLSVFCRRIPPGSLLHLDRDSGGCLITSVNGEACSDNCGEKSHAVIIDYNTTGKASRLSGNKRKHGVSKNQAINQ